MSTYILEQTRYKLTAMADFERARHQAILSYIWSKLWRRDYNLLPFIELEPFLPQQRIYRGIQEIPVKQIVGSVNRPTEFDRQFHPLKNDLEARWVSIRLLEQTIGWQPIRLYQVGNLYFVEDGHHRVSVAHYLQNQLIEAEVWAYPVKLTFNLHASRDEILRQLVPDSRNHAHPKHSLPSELVSCSYC